MRISVSLSDHSDFAHLGMGKQRLALAPIIETDVIEILGVNHLHIGLGRGWLFVLLLVGSGALEEEVEDTHALLALLLGELLGLGEQGSKGAVSLEHLGDNVEKTTHNVGFEVVAHL